MHFFVNLITFLFTGYYTIQITSILSRSEATNRTKEENSYSDHCLFLFFFFFHRIEYSYCTTSIDVVSCVPHPNKKGREAESVKFNSASYQILC